MTSSPNPHVGTQLWAHSVGHARQVEVLIVRKKNWHEDILKKELKRKKEGNYLPLTNLVANISKILNNSH